MFEWEESTFLGLKSLYRRFLVNPKLRDIEARRASLADHRSSLILLARMLSGQNLGIFETENAILCAQDRICLPPHFHEAETQEGNIHLYELKAILAALAHRDQWKGSLADFPETLREEFPFLAGKIALAENDLIPEEEVTLWDLLGESMEQGVRENDLQQTEAPGEQEESSADITTEIEGKGQLDVEVLAQPEDDLEGADMPTHTFEKAECLEETSGLNRKKDEDDELEEHEEALKEVDMKEVIRSQERPRSIYRSDLILDGLHLEVNDEASAGIPYPEWDYRKGRYKEDWCHLHQSHNQEQHPEWIKETERKHAALVGNLKRQFATIMSEFLKLKRQPFGSDFDLDAVVDAQVQLRSGSTPGEAIYLNQKKDIHDVSRRIIIPKFFWLKISYGCFFFGNVLAIATAAYKILTAHPI